MEQQGCEGGKGSGCGGRKEQVKVKEQRDGDDGNK